MKKLIEPALDFFEDETQWGLFGKTEPGDDATQAVIDEENKGVGKNILRNLAIFGVVAIALLLVLLLILVCKLCPGSLKRIWTPILNAIKKKVFWTAVIRFFIEGGLRLSFTTIFFLNIHGSFSSPV